MNFFEISAYFGVFVSIAAFFLGKYLQKKTNLAILNPLLISIIITILFLVGSGTSYETYYEGGRYLGWLLTPTTVCLAVPLYEQLTVLKHNIKAIFAGIISGVITSLLCVLAIALIFGLSHAEYVSMLPKSITTAMGIVVAEELGGYYYVTAVIIILTGLTGNILAPYVLKWFKIKDPVARGIAIGTSSHAIGTSRAMEMGDVEGAMSGLAIVVCGLVTVIGAAVFAPLA